MKVFRTRACFEEEIATARLYFGDCLEVLTGLDAESVSLVVTSPPYADQRADTYGGVAPDQYVEWFLPIARELHRVLKPDGTFILNIKEKVVDGERHTYVHELIAALRKLGWRWTEEFIWSKKNCFPGKWPTRFRDAWESCHQFNKSKSFRMFQDEVMVPIGDWAKARLANLSETDLQRDESKVGSGFGKKIANWVGREMVYPTNVLDFATECSNTGHSAAYPKELPTWFIKLFTQPGDWVLDPFLGSGTTCVAALELGRNSIGIEKLEDHYKLSEKNISAAIAL
jgi:site-specific DNA-methyltransferase (adenine-specific)